jgi:ferritin-like metal-binding protein YciE
MPSSAKDLYVTGLTNAHALEAQAIQLLERQVGRLENYPAMVARMREHIQESRHQQQRLEQILQGLGTSHSSLKDAGLGLIGNLAAMAHAPAQDEVLKNSFANYAFEHYEIAAYRSLILLAQAAGDQSGLPLLRQNLEEEMAMAKWISDHLDETTSTYLQRETSGQKAGV